MGLRTQTPVVDQFDCRVIAKSSRAAFPAETQRRDGDWRGRSGMMGARGHRTHNATKRNMIARWRCDGSWALKSPARLCRHEASQGSNKNSDCRNNLWISNSDSLTRVQDPRLANRPRVRPPSREVPTQAASVPSTLGPFLCLRNHDGKGVRRVNESSRARWRLATNGS